jgi:hypothetical protein
VHARDRLDNVFITTAAENIAGKRLFTLNINPETLGERLRRLASCFEMYAFESVQVRFESAFGTMVGGNILGFYDFDPVDTFDSGVSSLREAAAHARASAHKVWEEPVWHMPKPPSGRFYIDTKGGSDADKRLEQQANFHLMLDNAVELTSPVYPLNLGALYIDYVCRLERPTIQPSFVGMYSSFDYDLNNTSFDIPNFNGGTWIPWATTAFRDAAKTQMKGPLGITIVAHPTLAGMYGFKLATGVYILSNLLVGSIPSATSHISPRWVIYSSIDSFSTPVTTPIAYYGDSPIINAPIPDAQGTTTPSSRLGIWATYTTATEKGLSWGTRLVVPADTTYLVCPAIIADGLSTAVIPSKRFSQTVLVAPPLGGDPEVMTPSSDSLAARLSALESLLAGDIPARRGRKGESKLPIADEDDPAADDVDCGPGYVSVSRAKLASFLSSTSPPRRVTAGEDTVLPANVATKVPSRK